MGIHYHPTTSTYVVNAVGRVTITRVTSSCDIVTEWIDSVYDNLVHLNDPIVGIDVKRNPHGEDGRNLITVLTLYAGRQHCLVFQIRSYNLELENVENIAVTAAAEMQLEVMPMTSKDLLQAVFEMELVTPEVADCNWEDDPLSLEQIECATIDALVPFKVGKKFH